MSGDYQSDADSTPNTMSIGLADVYFVLFRRKWLILLCAILGVTAAGALWKLRKPLFQSQAKLLVRYVLEDRALASPGTDPQVRVADSTGGGLNATEGEILYSLDLANEVAAVVGPERIVVSTGDGTEMARASQMILRNLKIDVPLRSSIILLNFQHPDPGTAQLVLQRIIDAYLKKHVDIHRERGVDEALTQRRNDLKTRLILVENELKETKALAGVGSLEETKKANELQYGKMRESLAEAEADLAKHNAVVREYQKAGSTNASVNETGLPPQAKIDEYRSLVERLDYLEKRDRELIAIYTPEYIQVKTNRAQIAEARSRKAYMETNTPGLLSVPTAAGTSTASGVATDLKTQLGLIAGLEAKIAVLRSQMATNRAEARLVAESEDRIVELQRRKALIEAEYTGLVRSIEQAQFSDILGDKKSAPISTVQAPSPATRDFRPLYKKMAMAAFGGLAVGIALAFLLELFLDRTLKRPKDVEALFPAPLFVSIPVLKPPPTPIGAAKAARALLANSSNGNPSAKGGMPPDGSDGDEAMRPFNDALRDRLMNYFDVEGMTHKPKLVAVTSCSEGAGVSSVASGLAASLSETGEGNVLLVDMRGQKGAAHAFYQGKPAVGLADALENETRTNAQVQDKLYVVSTDAADQRLQRIMPRQFSHFVPKLKASDYEYIIFDMPPVGQISITGKVAKFMDMVLMVIESEKTDKEVARKAGALLAESKANVATVLNKRKPYVPGWLQQEFH
jgi:uncharacterized protein involved in exopolysaccharide biosynthesis/Mrp family chromosome partitioning ATPase